MIIRNSCRLLHPCPISNQIEARRLLLRLSNSKKMSSTPGTHFSENFFLRQLFDRDSCTYTYLIADNLTKEAALIDPVLQLADRDLGILKVLGFFLKYAINTHVHADHITGSGKLKKVSNCLSVLSRSAGASADVLLDHGEKIKVGQIELEGRATPGHTNGCFTYVCHQENIAFTGDALLIGGCGRTDFQEGNAATLYEGVWREILSLPEFTTLYPAHDYHGRTSTSVAEEKKSNPRLTKSKKEFVNLMENLGLSYPKMIDVALPANKVCGLYNLPEDLKHHLPEETKD